MVEIKIQKMSFQQDKLEDWIKYIRAIVTDAFRDTYQKENVTVSIDMKIKS